MNIKIIAVGKLKENYLKDAVAEYGKRLQRYVRLEIIEVRDEPVPNSPSRADMMQVLTTESCRIQQHIKDASYMVVLDIKGQGLTSEALARKVEQLMLRGNSRITFIIGGTLGLHPSILSQAHLRLSFSKLTFPHQLMRVILLEQLYRCFTIIKSEPYHK